MTKIADLGVIGLGTMGAMLALNFAEKGSEVALFNRTASKAEKLRADNPKFADRLYPQSSLEAFVASLRSPRVIVLMVNAGVAVDDQIEMLAPLLDEGDIVIDAGNTDFNDTVSRNRKWDDRGFHFVGWVCPAASLVPAMARRSWLVVISVSGPDLNLCWSRFLRSMMAAPALPGWVPMAPDISSRRSITASNMPTCR